MLSYLWCHAWNVIHSIILLLTLTTRRILGLNKLRAFLLNCWSQKGQKGARLPSGSRPPCTAQWCVTEAAAAEQEGGSRWKQQLDVELDLHILYSPHRVGGWTVHKRQAGRGNGSLDSAQHGSMLGTSLLSFDIGQVWTFSALWVKSWSVGQETFLNCQIGASIVSWCNWVIIPGAVWEVKCFCCVTGHSYLYGVKEQMFSLFIECNIANTEVTRVNMLCKRVVWIQLPVTTLVGSHLSAFGKQLWGQAKPCPPDSFKHWLQWGLNLPPSQAGYCFELLRSEPESFMSLILALSQH